MADEELIEQSQNIITNTFSSLSEKSKKILCDYVQEQYLLSIAKTIAYLGLSSPEAKDLLDGMHEEMREKVVSLCTFNKDDTEVVAEAKRILRNNYNEFEKEKNDIHENAFYCGHDFWKEKSDDFIKENPALDYFVKYSSFKFTDVKKLSGLDISKVMREVDSRELAKSLINADEDVQKKFFNNMSTRGAKIIQEDIQYLKTHVCVEEIACAQRKIVSIVCRLEHDGDIVISKNADDFADEEPIYFDDDNFLMLL